MDGSIPPFEVSRQGLTLRGFADRDDPQSVDAARALVREALRRGVTLFHSSAAYGPPTEDGYGSNLRLLRSCLEGVDRAAYQLMVEVGLDTRGGQPVLRADEASLKAEVDFALETLGVKSIDVLVMAAGTPGTPVEDSVCAMQKLLNAGKVTHLGLTNPSGAVIRRALRVTPIACVKQDWSLMCRGWEKDVVPLCRDLSIPILASSPLCRGILAGVTPKCTAPTAGDEKPSEVLEPTIPGIPNHRDGVRSLADRKGCTVAQLAVAWVNGRAKRHWLETVVPILGPSTLEHLLEDLGASDIALDKADLLGLEALFPIADPRGLDFLTVAT